MRAVRAALGAALVGALTALPGLMLPAQADEKADLTPMQRFGACVSGGGQGNVLMLFDTSGSLYRTDPNAGRVAAASATVDRLTESLATIPGADVQLAVAGFGVGYTKTLDWTPVVAGQAAAIKADLDTYAKKIDGVDTDYWSAMDGARREFSERAKGQANPCNLLMWFSDGEFDLKARESDAETDQLGRKPWAPDNALRSEADVRQAVDAATTDLCRPGGLADQERSLGIITVGIGLSVVDAQNAAPDFKLMKAISTGVGMACGAITDPSPGEFVMATDVDSLIYSFITALDPGGSGENQPCVNDACPEGTRTFVLDGSIGAVSAIAKAPVDGTRILLKTRTGDGIELKQGTGKQALNGAKLTWEWVTPRVLTMDLVREGQGDWAGPWGIVFIADAATAELAKSTISLKGDITPRLKGEVPALRSGEKPAQLSFEAADRSGNRIDPATLSDQTTLDVTLIVGGQSQTLATGLKKEAMEQPVAIPLDQLQPGVAELVLTLDVTTQSWSEGGKTVEGTKLEPRHASIPLHIAPPANFPSIPAKVSFGETEKADPVTIQVPVAGEGCVWLGDQTTFTGYPEGLGNAQLTSTATSRETCAQGSLPLTLDPGGLANGSFVGTTKVLLAAADAGVDPVTVELAFDLSQRRPASQPVLWTTLIGVTLLGIAIPLGILYLAKFLTAKIPGNGVLAGSAAGPVNDALAFTDNGVPIAVAQMSMAHLTGNRREVSVAGKTLKAKMGAAITEPGYVVVDTPGPSAGGRGTLQQKGGHAMLPLAVQGNWMVELDPQHPHSGPVQVTVFTAPGAAGLGELLEDVRSSIRTAVAKLRSGLPPEAAGRADDPWAGGGPGGPGAGGPAPDPWANPGGQAQPADPWSTPAAPASPGGPFTQPTAPRPAAPPPGRPAPPPAPAPGNDLWASPPSGPPPGPGHSSW